MGDRLFDYKNKGKAGEHRGKRREFAVSLRKDKRREKQEKRRDLEEFQQQVEQFTQTDVGQAILQLAPQIQNDLDQSTQFAALVQLRKHLANNKTLPIQATINSGVLPKMVEMLGWDHAPDTQYEAAWVLTNVSSGEPHQTMSVVEAGAAQPLCRLLLSPIDRVKDQACWCLGNVAGDGADLRDMLIEEGALNQFIIMLGEETNLDILRNVSWTLSNFFRWRNPPAPAEAMQQALPVLAHRVRTQDPEVLANVCWSICYIAEAFDDFLDPICREFGPLFIQILSLESHMAQLPALRALGSITAGEDEQTQAVIDLGLLPLCHQLFHSKKANIRKDTCWTLSNICAGSEEQIDAVIHENLLTALVNLALEDPVSKVQQDASWCLCNICTQGLPRHRDYVLKSGGLDAIALVLNLNMDKKALKVFLEALEMLLQRGEQLVNQQEFSSNTVVSRLEEIGFLDTLYPLIDHQDAEVSAQAASLSDTFFSETEQEIEGLVPQQGDGRYMFSQDAARDKNFDSI
ncbi:hypothetical protein PTSG_08661 [Salpingoeca rosetta]|uniref:Importin subunit alpha n=1 Tax=Salpingoeca rosetta (strain ATCC 50818 / BSB-021) TaxID=946362 RepID=F2UKB4_SALR5|nr:uncharacterized protein PTSG_08661 [Salpingoeca rosetta]EGD77563.1 hypothetical protein PTSG_08661 [Salpingoeca rosetta]|eukprot:XP_004990451.1 hypothetical protein PTSG_08661 [Salpingoeca rosetta]